MVVMFPCTMSMIMSTCIWTHPMYMGSNKFACCHEALDTSWELGTAARMGDRFAGFPAGIFMSEP